MELKNEHRVSFNDEYGFHLHVCARLCEWITKLYFVTQFTHTHTPVLIYYIKVVLCSVYIAKVRLGLQLLYVSEDCHL